ncbi:DUF4262 domain-containing protein [Streptomyces sp. NPDC015032]|uniref:DUF4262 domain-containing protein n=1 Tax=Streptomyces sp. NPDC015032 TaxID=3364937 RepID=UPI0036F753BC
MCPTDFLAGYAVRLRSAIAEHGFVIQRVGAREGSATFCYTIGLHESLGYEFVMVGLDGRVAKGVLRSVVERFSGSSDPVAGEVLDGLLEDGVQLLMRPVESLEPFAMLRAVYGEEIAVPYWQAVWPDPDGVFPEVDPREWTPGFMRRVTAYVT